MPWQVVEQEKSIDRLRLSFFVVVIFLFRVFRFASFSHMNPSGISCAQQQYCQIDVHTTAILLHYIIIDMIDIATDCWKLVPNVRTLQPNQNRLSQNIIYNLVLSGFWARDFFFRPRCGSNFPLCPVVASFNRFSFSSHSLYRRSIATAEYSVSSDRHHYRGVRWCCSYFCRAKAKRYESQKLNCRWRWRHNEYNNNK